MCSLLGARPTHSCYLCMSTTRSTGNPKAATQSQCAPPTPLEEGYMAHWPRPTQACLLQQFALDGHTRPAPGCRRGIRRRCTETCSKPRWMNYQSSRCSSPSFHRNLYGSRHHPSPEDSLACTSSLGTTAGRKYAAHQASAILPMVAGESGKTQDKLHVHVLSCLR